MNLSLFQQNRLRVNSVVVIIKLKSLFFMIIMKWLGRLEGKKTTFFKFTTHYNLYVNVAATILALLTFYESFNICNTRPLVLFPNDPLSENRRHIQYTVDDTFDGDIRIPVEMMLEYYNFSSFPGGELILHNLKKSISNRNTIHNGAVRIQYMLWSNKIIPYKISSNFSEKAINVIHKAMKVWEEKTCL